MINTVKSQAIRSNPFLGAKDNPNTLGTPQTGTFFKPPWFEAVQEEFKATREGVSVCDFSSFAKFDIFSSGSEAVSFLLHLCSNDIDIPIGTIVNTGMHNVDGGYENDWDGTKSDNPLPVGTYYYVLEAPYIQGAMLEEFECAYIPVPVSIYPNNACTERF